MTEDVETKVDFTKVNMNLSKNTISMVERYYPLLKAKGLVENKTQTLTYLASIGENILEQVLNGKGVYVGKDNGKKYDPDSIRKIIF